MLNADLKYLKEELGKAQKTLSTQADKENMIRIELEQEIAKRNQLQNDITDLHTKIQILK